MTREQAINYLFSRGLTHEQVSDVVRALTYEPTTKNEAKYCDRNICLKNEYNNIGCEDCEVTKSQKPTTKNDLPHCQFTDEEIAKSFIEDVEAVKDQLPCGEQMDFPNTFEEFTKDYGFKDKDEIYTNGSELIPVFRVKQWLEHISTTKNNLGVEEVTALAEWTTKLTKECEEAYNKGYADGVKSVNICPNCGEYI